MSDLRDNSALAGIGWRGPLPAGFVARIVAQHRAGYEIHDGKETRGAQPAAAFLRPGLDPEERPAVGDFVTLEPGAEPLITTILPRRSILFRAAAGERYKRQIIAANIDAVMVLSGLDGDFNPARIERYLALVGGADIEFVVLLTKADRHPEAAARAAALRERLGPATPVLAVNGKDPATRERLAPWLQTGTTVALVGSSGAGKSTLTNTLADAELMATAAVRHSDSRGRHTTSHRALLPLPGGACLIDTPGMRELKLTGEEDLETFAEIEALAARCRFRDCRHEREPGCAVQAAITAGDLVGGRLRNYVKLQQERERQQQTRAARAGTPRPRRRPAPEDGAEDED